MEDTTDPTHVGEEMESSLSPGDGNVTVKHVQNAQPVESLEERTIMQSLERSDPTGKSSRHFDKMLSVAKLAVDDLVQTPERHLSSLHSGDEDEAETLDELFALTKSINKIDAELQQDDTLHVQPAHTPPAEIFQDAEDTRHNTQGDQFAANAGHLFRRFERQNRRRNGGLQRSNANVKSAKGGGKGGLGKGGRKERRKFKKHKFINSIQPFNDYLKNNNSHVWSYVKTILFIIVPFTAAAALLYYVFDNPIVNVDSNSSILDSLLIRPSTPAPTPAPTNVTALNITNSTVPTPAPVPFKFRQNQPTTPPSGGGLNVFGGVPAQAPNVKIVETEEGAIVAEVTEQYPSYSWWVLFLGVRQVVTFGLAKGVGFLICQSAIMFPSFALCSPMMRVFILQAKGWPMHLFWWAILDLAMLYGGSQFADHWLFWQDAIGLFNAENPAGEVTSNPQYRGILIFSICFALAAAIKRFWVGMRFAKSSYYRYADKLSQVLRQLLLVSKVAQFAQTAVKDLMDSTSDFEMPAFSIRPSEDEYDKPLNDKKNDDDDDDDDDDSGNLKVGSSRRADGDDKSSIFRKARDEAQKLTERLSIPVQGQRPNLPSATNNIMSSSQEVKIQELLGEWEELEITDKPIEEVSMAAIVQFRASISVLDSEFPFSLAFGKCKTRSQVTVGSQRLYEKLQKITAESDLESNEISTFLRFSTIALVAMRSNGDMDRAMVKELMRFFRPNREGQLSLLDFCKSIDGLYKELRMLRKNIANEARLNSAGEKILNFVFYFICCKLRSFELIEGVGRFFFAFVGHKTKISRLLVVG